MPTFNTWTPNIVSSVLTNKNKLMGNILKTIVVLLLASIITFAGMITFIYWLNTPLSFVNVLAFVVAYFIVLKPSTKYWTGFLVFLAEYKTIKAQMQERKEIMEKFRKDMETLQSSNEQDRERIANEYREKVQEIVNKLKENEAKQE